MILREIQIDGKMVPFRASATIPRIYRAQYHRDIFRDLIQLEKEINIQDKEESSMGLDNLEVFENVAYLMAKHADPSQPSTPEEWLEQFNTFSIYEVLPQLLELWQLNIKTDVEAKKKQSEIAAGK